MEILSRISWSIYYKHGYLYSNNGILWKIYFMDWIIIIRIASIIGILLE